MASTSFSNGTVINAAWLVDVNSLVWGVFNGATTAALARTALGLDASSGSSLIGFLQSGTGAVASTVQAKLREVPSALDFGAVGDDSTDDNDALQKLLNVGGKITLNGNKTYKNAAANLTFSANTELYIEAGTTLHLVGTRISAIAVDNVKIINHGLISSTSLNTSDSFPSGWNARGIVEFGGTVASPSTRVGIEGPGRITGDFVGTPGTTTINFQDKRRGVVLNNVINGWCRGQDISGVIAEAVWYGGSTNDRDVDISYNSIRDCNHDAISSESVALHDLRIHHNFGQNCLNGIECIVGTCDNNFMREMIGGGYTIGGNAITNEVRYLNNIGYNNTTTDYSMANGGAASGSLVMQGNLSIGSGASAVSIQNVTELSFIGNEARGWGRLSAASGIGLGGGITRGVASGNTLRSPGASSNGGFSVGGNTQIVWGQNFTEGVANPYLSFDTSGGGIDAPITPVLSQAGTASLTGSVAETTLRSQTIKAKSLGDTGGFRVIAAGACTGASNTKTIRLKFGGTTLATITEAAGNTDAWRIDAVVQNTSVSQAVQSYDVISTQALAVVQHAAGGASINIDTTADQTVLVSGQLANAGDGITMTLFQVQPILGIS